MAETMTKLQGAKKAAFILFGFPYTVIVMVFIFLPLGLLSGVGLVCTESCVWLRMRLRGRFLSGRVRRRRFADGHGTVIIESPMVGWNVTRAWWTDEDVLALAPAAPPTKDDLTAGTIWDHPFVRWAHERYTDIRAGRASLLRVWNGTRLQRRLSKRYPRLRFVEVWSGFASFPAAFRPKTTASSGVSSSEGHAHPR